MKHTDKTIAQQSLRLMTSILTSVAEFIRNHVTVLDSGGVAPPGMVIAEPACFRAQGADVCETGNLGHAFYWTKIVDIRGANP